MKTIQEIFGENLRKLRGSRSQAKMAEEIGIPTISYQRAENGDIPQRANLDKIVAAFGVPEAELFIDYEHFKPKVSQDALDDLLEFLEIFPKLDNVGRQLVLTAGRLRLSELGLNLDLPGGGKTGNLK